MRGNISSSPSQAEHGDLEKENLENKESGRTESPHPCNRSVVNQSATAEAQDHPWPMNLDNPAASCQSPFKNDSSHRKRVRRRGQTRKPYQEELMSMAEARREIVAALKLHRDRRKRDQINLKSSRNPRIHASNFTGDDIINSPANYCTEYFTGSPGFCSPYHPWPVSPLVRPLDFTLPAQTLGLNLNLKDFGNLQICSGGSSSSILYSDSSLSVSASNSSPAAAERGSYAAEEPSPDEGAREEISPIGEGLIHLESGESDWDFASSPFENAVVEFPAWLSAEYESCFTDMRGFCGVGGGSKDAALPCMDIEEIEETDGDWLA